MSAWTPVDGGVLLTILVTPKGGRDRIDGLRTDANGRWYLSVRVGVAPADGAATAAVIAVLADALQLSKRDVILASGATSRVKRIRLDGDSAAITARLETMTKDGG